LDFNGQTILITGGSSGIGLALARQFAASGSRLILVARQSERLKAALTSLPASGNGNHLAIPTDITDPDQVSQMAEQVTQEADIPDILINNAGAAHPGYVQDLDLGIFEWLMNVNYFGAVYVTKAFLPGMIKRRSGHIVNIASLAGFAGIFGYSAYSPSKFALRGFSDSLRVELKPHGIQVSIVYPSDTDTPQLAYENQYKPIELKEMLSTVNMKPYHADIVASRILKSIAKKKAVIITDIGTSALFFIVNHFGNIAYPFQDYLVSRALKKIQPNGNHPNS
jgi:3-dehydrosphinganine reductase